MRIRLITATLAVGALTVVAACSGDDGDAADSNTVTVVYQRTAEFHQLDDMLVQAKDQYEAENEGITIELSPIEADQDQYFTRLALMNGSASTAPDVIYEDTFQIRSDAAAGYLLPIDSYLENWDDWDQFNEQARQAGVGDDGQTYGISMGTDTRGIYYNTDIFEQAGLPTDWQPESWDDILDAAHTVQAAAPDVIPMNIYAGRAGGEQTSMQGFEMLLYGTDDTLYDEDNGKWVIGSQGFLDSLSFMNTVYSEELGPPLHIPLDSAGGSRVSAELIPQAQLAIAIDGSWLPGSWISGDGAWPEWEETMGFAAMPTQNGQDPGFTSMSGGWTLAVGSQADDPQAAFDFITYALSQERSEEHTSELQSRFDLVC